MKKIFLSIFITIMFVLLPNYAEAAGQLSKGDIEIECVYDNGISIAAYYENEAYGMSATDFKLSNAISPPYSTKLTYFYKEAEFAKSIVQSATCPSSIGYMVVQQFDNDENNVTFQVYFNPDDTKYLTCCNSPYDEEFFKSNIVAGFSATRGAKVAFDVMEGSPLDKRSNLYLESDPTKKTSFEFQLKAERIYFNNDVEASRQWAFKSEGEQAASNPIYVRISEYTTENGTTIKVAEKDQNSTKINIALDSPSSTKSQFICFGQSTKVIENNKNDMAYSFSQIRHNAQKKGTKNISDIVDGNNGYSCSSGQSLYREVSWDEAEESEESGTSICEVIPETSLLIAKIINYARIMVPVLLIIYTAIDITKIVISGEVEEELPKKRKVIIIRIIVAVAFFFIPLLVQIFISSNYGIDFGDISCLW